MSSPVQEPPMQAPEKMAAGRRRVLRLIIVLVVLIPTSLVCVSLARTYLPKVWGDLHVVNFVVAWIPAVLGVLVAFVPDKELQRGFRIAWRSGVIVCGVLYSITLWHQQTLTDAANAETQQQILRQSLADANKHADEQFGKVNGEVQQVSKGLSETKDALVNALNQNSSAVTASIGRVGKLPTPDPAVLTFTLWSESPTDGFPVRKTFAAANDDGSYPVEFSFLNTSSVTAKGVDIWLDICDGCTFAKEPPGFEHPEGMLAQTRHRRIGDMNPGVSYPKTSFTVKAPNGGPSFAVGFRYTCENCGGKPASEQLAEISHSYIRPPHPDPKSWRLGPLPVTR